jgi:hypothetical protein
MKVKLVSNLHQVKVFDWEDHKEKKVIVRTMMDGQTIHHGISRSVKHISVIARITAG